jgi:hypothetical protein
MTTRIETDNTKNGDFQMVAAASECSKIVQAFTADEKLTVKLTSLVEQLESCQKSLAAYLESKRIVFPR